MTKLDVSSGECVGPREVRIRSLGYVKLRVTIPVRKLCNLVVGTHSKTFHDHCVFSAIAQDAEGPKHYDI